jgi:hypothetical protein
MGTDVRRHFSDWFERYYGPIHTLAGTLDEPTSVRFADDLAGEYLEAVGVRR